MRHLIAGVLVLFCAAPAHALSLSFTVFDDFYPYGINDAGDTVGDSISAKAGVFRSASGTVVPIIIAGNSLFPYPRGINDRNVLVGGVGFNVMVLSGGVFDVFNVRPFPGGIAGDEGFANGINNHGDIVGYGLIHHELCPDGQRIGGVKGFLLPLGQLDAKVVLCPPGPGNLDSRGINDQGDIVGDYFLYEGPRAGAFLRLSDGTFIPFDVPGAPPPPPGFITTFATGINNARDIVGSFQDARGSRGFLLKGGPGGPVTYVDPPGAKDTFVNGISNRGELVGYFQGEDGKARGFIATPAIDVAIDVMPASCPSIVRTGAQGLLAVAILGSSAFDVRHVDPASVRLQGVAPSGSRRNDVGTPSGPLVGRQPTDCNTKGADGEKDLRLTFDTHAVIATLGSVTSGEKRTLELTGRLKPEFGGTPIRGEDAIVVRNP